MTESTSARMPVVFAGHGSPMNAINDSAFTRGWRRVGESLPRPRAILAISAHWFAPMTAVNDEAKPRQVYDMYGFPRELYQLTYPAPGAPGLAARVRELLGARATVDDEWGIDHGTWAVLAHMLPSADVPLTQLSVNSALSPRQHLELGRALAPLRDEGVLILASGNTVHNLGEVEWDNPGGSAAAVRFSDRVRDLVVAHDAQGVLAAMESDPDAPYAIPTPDHFLPLLYALGASDDSDKVEVYNDGCELGSMSMTGFVFRAS